MTIGELPGCDAKIKKIREEEDLLKKTAKASEGESATKKKTTIASKIQKLVETDRAVFNAANDAFVSFIRAYIEHQLKYLFILQEFPIGEFATYIMLALTYGFVDSN